MNQTAGAIGYAQTANAPAQIKGTAVDSINANIESLTNRAETLCRFAARISNGILGVIPDDANVKEGAPRPVTQSTQDHLRDLETAFERLSVQINRLG